MTALAWIHISVSSHIHTWVLWAEYRKPGHNDHRTTDIVFGTSDKHARNQAPKLVWSLFLIIDNLIEVMWIDGIIPRLRYELYSNWTNVCDRNIHQAVYQGFMTGDQSLFLPNWRWQMLMSHDFLLMGNSCLWGGLNCGNCWFPHSLAIFCTSVQYLAPYTQFEQHRDLAYHLLYRTQMVWVWLCQEGSGRGECNN